jgi:lipid II isoglutaminyl synthase (glutamine-hydrolysing)
MQSPLTAIKAAQMSSVASARRAIAVSMGKAVRGGSRRLGKGNGTAVPGAVALAIDPGTLAGLVAEIPRGAVLVTGSNGKGTTCRMLAEVMRAAGLHAILNREGSNQLSGLATTLVASSSRSGHLPADDQAIGLFEVDEGSFPRIIKQIARPRALVFTNVFRDQLDRYLEPAYLVSVLERTIRNLPADTTLVLNADDPRVAYLAPELENPRLYFGIQDTAHGRDGIDPTSDFPRCPRCGGELAYGCVFYAHLGHWVCHGCGLARPEPRVRLTKIDLLGFASSRVQAATAAAEMVLEIPVPGLYNAYNAAAALAAATACRLPDRAFSAIERVTPNSLRMERVEVAGHDVYLTLAKNANGYTEVLRAVLGDGQPKRIMLGLNDCAGKQPDTSWIWDVDFDSLSGLIPSPVITGNRAHDLAVRLKYAGWLGTTKATTLTTEPDPVRAFQLSLARTPPGDPLWLVSTSIVLHQVRRWLRQQGFVRDVWQEQDQRAGAAL